MNSGKIDSYLDLTIVISKKKKINYSEQRSSGPL